MPELLSLLRVDIVSVIVAALLFYVVSVWFNVAAIWSELKTSDDRAHYNSAVKFAWLWTAIVVVLVIMLYIARILTKSLDSSEWGTPAWGGHDVSHMPQTIQAVHDLRPVLETGFMV